ncbi:HET-domain-containing protein [Venturia nashicola]|uniref:HET-domain-containing protein n=1 Tax=Venturia nashicola TaxID=86259 RepID=A0A4Z1PWF4_9PEZI|nr:HET-domain-containing protein [Venturia nashicola]
MWIDAICINQKDNMEKNWQVAQMGSVYTQASRVVIWLGREQVKATELSEINGSVAVDILREGGDGFSDDDICTAVPRWTWAFTPALTVEDTDVTPGLPYSGMMSRALHRSYWTRLWIIQEVALGVDIIIRCGGLSVNWHGGVWELCRLIDDNKQQIAIHNSNNIAHSTVYILNNHRNPPEKQPRDGPANPKSLLLDLVIQFRKSKCQNVLDRVFGVLTLAQECCRDATPVDYSLEPAVLAAKILDHYLAHHAQNSRKGLKICIDVLKALDLVISYAIQEDNEINPPNYDVGTLRHLGAGAIPLPSLYSGKIIWIGQESTISTASNTHVPERYLPEIDGVDLTEISCLVTYDGTMYFNRNSTHPCNTSTGTSVSATFTRHASQQLLDQITSLSKSLKQPESLQTKLDTIDTGAYYTSTRKLKVQVPATEFKLKLQRFWETHKIRYFVTSTGLKGLCTSEARLGNRVCEFENGERRLAIVAMDGDECRLIGKGLAFPTKTISRFSLLARKRVELELEVDMETLFYLAGYF